MLRADGFESVDEVVFADLGDVPVLGSRTLDGFGAIVDARGKRLVAAGRRPSHAHRPTGIADRAARGLLRREPD
jgi:hypothetical protein